MSDFTSNALAGKTFFRAIATPQRTGYNSYLQLYNPPNSGKNIFLDAVYVWPGLASASGEYGFIHYATPFNAPALSGIVLDVFQVNFTATKIGASAGVAQIFGGTYPGFILGAGGRVEYFWQSPNNTQPGTLEKFPYPVIIGPNDGVLFWNATAGLEGKVGLWIREENLPV